MQDKDNKTNPSTDPSAAATAAVSQAAQGDFIKKVVEKIKNSENILIALSREPSVDEIAAAIGLAMFLDGIQKHTTAIYSGRVPDGLTFLQPTETFETNTDSLQDFIISLDKNKADHLRYKLEGDFVKIFITPYKSTLSEDDLTFSHGDYNVDFVIAINVSAAGKLDQALREHSRIMRDASIVNVTTGDPGHFGEIEWSNPTASSLCEMITDLIFAIQESDEKPLEHDIATTLLAGIVAATDRFSNNRTNPDTLGVASKLMSMGADQQLITSNISGNDIIHNEDNYSYNPQNTPAPSAAQRSNLTIDHEEGNTPSPAPNTIPPTTPDPTQMQIPISTNASAVTSSAQPFDPTKMQLPNPNSANPAAMSAPTPNIDQNPSPTAMIDNTNNVNPESVIVQPIIPGAKPTAPTQPQASAPAFDPSQMQLPNSSPTTVPTAPSTPDPSQMQLPTPPADKPTPGRGIMTDAPTAPTAKQVGNTITPPKPTPKQPKNYAEMMEAALSENPPQQAPSQPITQPNPTPSTPTTNPTQSAQGTSSSPDNTTKPTPSMEPVASPTASAPVLPPPPAPNANAGMMPPVLPPVQVPPQV